MSEPVANQSKEFSAFRQEFTFWKRVQPCCKLMLAASLEDFAERKTVQFWYQKYGRQRTNDYFAAKKKQIWENLVRKFGAEKHFAKYHGKEKKSLIEFYWIKWSTEAARQLKTFELLGLADALVKGDERGFLIAGLKAKPLRDDPKKAADVEDGLADLFFSRKDYDFVGEVGKIRKQLPADFSQFGTDKVEEFLLRLWDTPWHDKAGKLMPPLCYFTDKPLELVVHTAFKGDTHTPGSLRKKWIRLGLLRAKADRVRGLKKEAP